MEIFVNGKTFEVEVDSSTSLLSVLRDHLHLTGTKNGCSKGDCGACTVLVDGEPARSCITPVRRVEGKRILTIEGLGSLRRLHPLQIAFLKTGAVQCGFCTPGMILSAKALLDKNGSPSVPQIKAALARNLCRCTGYEAIVDAVLLAGKALRGETQLELEEWNQAVIGSSVIDRAAIGKVTGSARYSSDLYHGDMLIVGAVRSPHCHARILDIDTSQAQATDGVEVVISAQDIPGINRVGTTSLKDQPILAEGKVRYLGEPIVAIAARDKQSLKRAIGKVRITFQELDPVVSPAEALKERAPLVHDSGNVLYSREVVHGDIERGFRDSDVTVEGEFSTSLVEHAYLEPEAGLAYQKDGTIYMYTGGQDTHFYQAECARILGLKNTELHKLRVIQMHTGGGFGGKIDISVQGIIALLAARTSRPVKYVYTREESFVGSTKRHPFTILVKVGARRDGRLQALRVNLLADTGAYASWGRAVLTRASVHATGPYEIPNVFVEGRVVYTNNPVCGAFRGFGVPQVTFAIESAMDMLAHKLDIDPLQLRTINAFKQGSVTATGQTLHESVGIRKCLSAVGSYYVKEKAEIQRRTADKGVNAKKLGVGIGTMWFGIGYTGMPNPSAAAVELRRTGKFHVYTGACDIGQGSSTVLWQIAAQSLGVPLELVEMTTGDTGLTSNTNITCASRQTSFTGNAIRDSATAMREMIIKLATEVLGEGYPQNIFWENGAYWSRNCPDRALTMKEVYRQLRLRNLPTKLSSVFSPFIQKLDERSRGIPYASYAFATHVAVVEVDTKDKSVRVCKVIAAHDVGKAINRLKVEGQIAGGVVMGLGYALKEEYIPGKTRNYKNYRIPTINDTPEMMIIVVEDSDPYGPFGAKGLGEPAMIPAAPAIANAIFDAVGFRATHLPIRLS